MFFKPFSKRFLFSYQHYSRAQIKLVSVKQNLLRALFD